MPQQLCLCGSDALQIRGSDISCDESALTGESDEVKKSAEKNPFLLSGTAVMKGTGSMLVTCVGLFSEEGIIQKLITGVGQEEVWHDCFGLTRC